MSEEKPVFKVTDRRLFNPDGTPRDIEREDRATETAPDASPASLPTDAATTTVPATAPTHDAASSGATTATDPLFIELMMFVAENAAAMLGGHPQLGGEANLPYAKQFIDMLGSLRDKTTGKLSLEEQNTLDTLLSQLRMQYVSLTNAPRAGGGLTSSDITGGR